MPITRERVKGIKHCTTDDQKYRLAMRRFKYIALTAI